MPETWYLLFYLRQYKGEYMPININELTIKQVRGYFEVYINGKFFCTEMYDSCNG